MQIRGSIRLAALVLSIVGCVAPPPVPSTPVAPAPSASSGTSDSSAVPVATATPSILLADCPDSPFDGDAVLGPEFAKEYFERDESQALAQDFLGELAALYAARPAADPCDAFTARGLAEALAFDTLFAAVRRGDAVLEGELVLRLRNEGSYDLRRRPPSVPLDLIFDILPGARLTDRVRGGVVEVSTAVQRFGMQVTLQFDGHRWRVNWVGPVSPEQLAWTRLPPVPLPGQPCATFRRDLPGAPFDDDAGPGLDINRREPRRRWCDEDGAGRLIRVPEQLYFNTRFPCDRGRIAILSIGRPVGAPLDPLVRWEYMRDPDGEALANKWLTAPWDGTAALPPDAVATGWTNGNIDLWTSDAEQGAAVYLVRAGIVERWPRAAEQWGVTDCN